MNKDILGDVLLELVFTSNSGEALFSVTREQHTELVKAVKVAIVVKELVAE